MSKPLARLQIVHRRDPKLQRVNEKIASGTVPASPGFGDQCSLTPRLTSGKECSKEYTNALKRGHTNPEHADANEAMLKPELLPGISKVRGYRGSYLPRRKAGDEVEFITIMIWDSIDAIRAVTGADYETAVIPEERRKYLSRHDAKSAHYEIASLQKPDELSSVIA
jgi:heme-degrading monooxygenase HmoA